MASTNPDEFRDVTARLIERKIYVICHDCNQIMKAIGKNRIWHFCADCRNSTIAKYREAVLYQRSLAYRKRLPATLTPKQWFFCLEYFDYKCAYCGAQYCQFEHYIPLARDGGTTAYNCFPSCKKCNESKGTKSDIDMKPEYRCRFNSYRKLVTIMYDERV